MILIGRREEKVRKNKSHLPPHFRLELANWRVTTPSCSPLKKPRQRLSAFLPTEENEVSLLGVSAFCFYFKEEVAECHPWPILLLTDCGTSLVSKNSCL